MLIGAVTARTSNATRYTWVVNFIYVLEVSLLRITNKVLYTMLDAVIDMSGAVTEVLVLAYSNGTGVYSLHTIFLQKLCISKLGLSKFTIKSFEGK